MKSILLVEDSPAIMELIRFLRTTFGYESREAGDMFEALKIARENRLDLILPDIQLPGDGLEVLKETKTTPEIRRMPVIALIARAVQGDEGRFLKAECSGDLSKPIDIGGFKSMIQINHRWMPGIVKGSPRFWFF